jgi:2-succinyl-5-enolpyruvyl-6-hydroxy-3-cyclohexene-1-carboxylate synthase
MLRDLPSKNALWGFLVAEELARLGVRHAVIAPGSRSTPLVAALVSNPRLSCQWAIDERAAGFVAIGIARASAEPAVVVTTSGTAVANLLPAVVEADLDGEPLVVLTADRPPELHDSGANQSIRQLGIFGARTRWDVSLPCPDDDVPARFVLTTIDEAVARARGPHPGPVHLNFPFREPLAPSEKHWERNGLVGLDRWEASVDPFTIRMRAEHGPSREGIRDLATRLRGARQGLLVAGTLRSERDRTAVRRLAEALGWPLVADIRSGLRHGQAPRTLRPYLDRFFEREPAGIGRLRFDPDVVLQLGARPTSRRVASCLDTLEPAAAILVDSAPRRLDPTHRLTHRVEGSIASWCDAVLAEGVTKVGPCLPDHLERAHAELAAALEAHVENGETLTEPFVARYLSQTLGEEEALFVSSSMPIRDLDTFADPRSAAFCIDANRGASGIDGVVASAVGFAHGRRAPTTLLIGDLALLHDLGSLFLVRHSPVPIGIVVVNNGGGSIFSFLPIAEHRDLMTPWFDAGHEVAFRGVAADMGLPYTRVMTRAELCAATEGARHTRRSYMIEVVSSLAGNLEAHRAIDVLVTRVLREAVA